MISGTWGFTSLKIWCRSLNTTLRSSNIYSNMIMPHCHSLFVPKTILLRWYLPQTTGHHVHRKDFHSAYLSTAPPLPERKEGKIIHHDLVLFRSKNRKNEEISPVWVAFYCRWKCTRRGKCARNLYRSINSNLTLKNTLPIIWRSAFLIGLHNILLIWNAELSSFWKGKKIIA